MSFIVMLSIAGGHRKVYDGQRRKSERTLWTHSPSDQSSVSFQSIIIPTYRRQNATVTESEAWLREPFSPLNGTRTQLCFAESGFGIAPPARRQAAWLAIVSPDARKAPPLTHAEPRRYISYSVRDNWVGELAWARPNVHMHTVHNFRSPVCFCSCIRTEPHLYVGFLQPY